MYTEVNSIWIGIWIFTLYQPNRTGKNVIHDQEIALKVPSNIDDHFQGKSDVQSQDFLV